MTELDWVVVGRFGRPHGIKGLVSVISFTEPRDNIMHYTHWHIRLHDQWQPIQLKQIKMNVKSILAEVEGFVIREDVARLTNVEIAIKRCQLPKLSSGEYYWHQLVGMKVLDHHGVELGIVTDMMSTGAHDVLVVEGDRRHLIPYLPGKFVISVNETERTITVDWDRDF